MTLLDYCSTDHQRAVIQLYLAEKRGEEIARELGLDGGSVRKVIRKVKENAAKRGYAPDNDMKHPVAPGFHVKGVSTFYNMETGEPTRQWVKTDLDKENLAAMMQEVADELSKSIKPLPAIPSPPENTSKLLNLYTLTDIHIGMLAWHEEGGEDWDLKIAEETIISAFAHLIERSPGAEVGFFNQLGDGVHSDGLIPATPTSGHVLDQDGRFHKIVRAVIRIFRSVVCMMLEKYPKVVVLMAQGNHDLASSVWLQEWFSVLFEDNDRVKVVVSPKPYYAYQHGGVMLAFHHGHKSKPEKMPDVFMGEFRQMFGSTTQTYIHSGHMHHAMLKEFNSAIVEQHTTLAARDAYASHGGYKAERAMKCITYHKDNLEIGRVVYRPTMKAEK
jgi:hypothetical protein